MQLGSNLLEAPKLELLSKLELLAKQRELLSLFCNDPPTCGADADATFTYSQVPLVAREARVAYDLLTKNNTSLPGREELIRTITEWLPSRRGGFDQTRSEVPVIVNAPGTGKTTLLLRLATALEILISSDDTSEKRPVLVAFTYNTEMAASIPHKLLWPDADEDQRIKRCVALRMLYGALRSMGCRGVKTWPEVLMNLQAGGLAAAIHDPEWALGILEAWFGTDREFVVAADELLKGVTERNEAATTKVLQVGDGPVQLQGGVWLYGELDDTGEDMRDAAKCLVDVVLAAASRVRLRKPALTLPKKRGKFTYSGTASQKSGEGLWVIDDDNRSFWLLSPEEYAPAQMNMRDARKKRTF